MAEKKSKDDSKKPTKRTAAKKPATTKKAPVVKTATKAAPTPKKVETRSEGSFLKATVLVLFLVLGASAGFNLKAYMNQPETDIESCPAAEENIELKNPEFNKEEEKVMADGVMWLNLGPEVQFDVWVDSTCTVCSDISTNPTIAKAFPFAKVNKVELKEQTEIPEGLTMVPTILIDKEIEKTPSYQELSMYLTKAGDKYELDPAILGAHSNKIILDKSKIPTFENNAKLTIVEYSEFACPYCKSFATQTKPKIVEEYGNDVVIEFRNFVVHPQVATEPAIAGHCTKKIFGAEKFWEMHDLLFEDYTDIDGTATQLGINTQEFKDCLTSEEAANEVAAQGQEGRDLGIGGTPAFIVGDTFVSGAIPFESFKEIIDIKLNN
ncbi:MAG: thioredoxin domain-containing protein [Candidatus Gracilibacteria bacterium]|jgi:protein-disulfide isomerase|nr:thioredoxin domain-containing protein [Candidatus Gracilibacteria bacterium]